MLNKRFLLSNINLRAIKKDDLYMVLKWRNSENIRKFMLSDRIITFKEHVQWFNRTNNDTAYENLIAEYNGSPIGFLSIADIDHVNRTCTWGMYVGDNHHNLGVGVLLEICAIDRMFNFHKIRKIWGQVFLSNRIRFLHYKLGFTDEGILKKYIYRNGDYEDLVLVSLFSDKWNRERGKIIQSLGVMQE
jgi:UDP-4-amino-4,6-dideoxy-N-acetyl-beta-L-altrosamine N-acetyltransferase